MNGSANEEDEQDIAAALREMGLLRKGGRIHLERLGGGVSCDVFRADLDDGAICVKRALPKLRVEADWHAPAERAASEVAWLGLVRETNAAWAPSVLGEDRSRHLFAMEYLPPSDYPVWKAQLASGHVDIAFAEAVGSALAHIHAATANRPDLARQFANAGQFHALRVEPYLLYTASRHPDLAPQIRECAKSLEDARIALVHGDVSPKNILCGSRGPVFLDAETTTYGDPAFDLAFCLNHLLLKCVWRQRWRKDYLNAFAALARAYLAVVTWEAPEATERRAGRLLPTLLLARIDGKSPVEYLTAEGDRQFVRVHAKLLLARDLERLEDIAACWNGYATAAGQR